MKNLKEFADRSTIHGFSYVFDREIPAVDRFLWSVVLGVSCLVVGFLIFNSFDSWQKDMVITTLKNKAKPVTELEFPALTICSSGSHMELVEKVIYNNFLKWQNIHEDESEKFALEEMIQRFMEEKFQIKKKGESILDILNVMIDPRTDSSSTQAVIINEQACNSHHTRKKRATQGLLILFDKVLF